MPSYHKIDDDVKEVLATVLKTHHLDLIEAGVRIHLLGAKAKQDSDGIPKGPALKLHGVAALAIASILSLEDRVSGSDDCRIKIDMDRWPALTDRKREALLHHEALHFILVRDADGNIQTDDACRPKLKMRPHDFDCGLFWEAVEHYGDDSCEAEVWKPANKKMTQLLIPFTDIG